MKRLRLLLGVVLAGAMLVLASGASATPVFLGIGPGDSIAFTNGAVSGTITLESIETVPVAGAVATSGTTNAGDVALVFSATIDGGADAIDSIGVGLVHCDPGPLTDGGSAFVDCSTSFPADFGRTATSWGWGPDGGGVDVSLGGSASTPVFTFVGDLDASETSDEFFTAYAPGDVLFAGQHFVNFMISPADGSSDFTVSIQLAAPEPGVVALLLLGATGLMLHRRRRS